MIDGSDIETASPQFVRQLAAELIVARRQRRRPLWWMARTSGGRFSRRDLRDAENGRLALESETVAALAELYGVEMDALLPNNRGGLEIRPEGLISSAGVSVPFTPGDDTSLIAAYFRLSRQLRQLDDATTMPLRRDDLRTIAQFLGRTGSPSAYIEAVLAASIAERRVLVGSLVAGAVSIGLAGVTPDSAPAVALEHPPTATPPGVDHGRPGNAPTDAQVVRPAGR